MEVCRNEFGYHPVQLYLNLTCSLCYVYTFHSADPQLYPLTYNADGFLVRASLHSGDNNRTNSGDLFLPLAHNRSSPVYSVAFPEWEVEDNAAVWDQCCRAAASCCQEQLRTINDANNFSCPPTWDGWQCWSGATAGKTLLGTCPRYINPHESPVCSGSSEKTCTEAGNWLHQIHDRERNFSKEWTDYSACFNLAPLEHRFQVQILTYCISIIFLAPALLIFWKCKQLHVQRNMIHVNFFTSLLLYAVVLIVFQTTVTGTLFENPETVLEDHGVIECRLVYALTMYLRLCNYSWMFCEGLFLLRHLKHVFMREQRFSLYIVCGWGFPFFPVGLYTGLRWSEVGCWVAPIDLLDWILKGPALVLLGLNFIFLWYIVCLLVKKLQMRYVSEVAKFRKSCRAVLVLMPLFGLHFIITAYRPRDTCYMQWYFFLTAALDGLQGFFVALTFCYSNGEVISIWKTTIARWRGHTRALSRSNSSQQSGGSCCMATRSLSTVTRITMMGSIKTSPQKSGKSSRPRVCRYESLMGRQESLEKRELPSTPDIFKVETGM